MTARPRAVLRAPLGRWGAALVLALGVVVSGALALGLDGVIPATARLVVAVALLLAFGWLAAAVWAVTVRWRTSIRSDGEALVVRGPLGASVVPFHDGLTIGRWLDRRQRPRLWVLEGRRPIMPLSVRLGSARIEAFAGVIGLRVIDHTGLPPGPDDLDSRDLGATGTDRDDGAPHDPYRPDSLS
ncbi:MAG: hypothetical protein RJQ01_02445 [Microcella sp.]|uniref:hypothetical protein n=1 Tax=Microcella sp. TaxID=1913979 RepID=UPI0033146326